MAKAKPITGLDLQASPAYNARQIASVRLEELYEWSQYVDQPFAIRELHNMRIAAKRLRYTLEIFADYLPEECAGVVKILEQIQEQLGQLHDSDVLIALLRLVLGSQEFPLLSQFLNGKQQKNSKVKSMLPPELMATLLDPATGPNAEEQYGLEQLLRSQVDLRDQQYQVFRQYWYHLQEQDFRRHLLGLLDRELVAS